MTKETVKGFRDFQEEEAKKRAEIKKILIEYFERYGFEPAETPVIEYENFVKENNPEDEAISDVFKLKDKGGRNLALRYEFTFQLKRLMQNKKFPYKRYQIGPVFRDEPVSANRVRQITQCDVDIVGISDSIEKNEAEILSLTNEVLNELNVENEIYVGNRALIEEILEKQGITSDKEQIMREIDKLDKLKESEVKENLKKYNAENLIEILKQPEKEFEKYSSYSQIKKLREACSNYGVEIKFVPSLVRGLSYYNGNVWEIKTKKMKETITAGGSYKFNNTQATGISFGLERISQLSGIETKKNSILIVSLDEDKQAIKIAQKLRKEGTKVSVYYGKPSKALSYADSYNIKQVIFVGAKEVKQKKFKVKNMKTGEERYLTRNRINKKNLIVQRNKKNK